MQTFTSPLQSMYEWGNTDNNSHFIQSKTLHMHAFKYLPTSCKHANPRTRGWAFTDM